MTITYEHKEKPRYASKQVWAAATGLQQVDGLTPSKYLEQLANENVSKRLSLDEIEKLLYDHYESIDDDDAKEADIVSKRIAEILTEESFTFSPITMVNIHERLFKDIMPEYAGKIRNVNLTKGEPILNYNTVTYADHAMIREQMRYDFDTERDADYAGLSPEKTAKRIAKFTRNIWQTHPFMEGNTRTTAVFMEKYLRTKGYAVDNSLFAEKSLYFRNALVRANYADYGKGISETTEFIEKFYENLLFGGKHALTNKELLLVELFPEKEPDPDIDEGKEN